ncbi:MAG TPA: tetratricopeptide repeat protein [Actinomycetota bacterium]|nr:tetratricopeptide repeat protein [Actinomycetota bacterium]
MTFMFTDIEGSTYLLQRLGEAYPRVLSAHNDIVRSAIEAQGGREVSTEGDSFFVVFPTAPQATAAAVAMQRALADHPWPDDAPVAVRMGLHTGQAVIEGQTYVGLDVNRAARIAAAGHGGQIVISSSTRGLVEHALPDGTELRDLGEHRLKDLAHPEHLFQLVIEELASEFPPLRSLDARPNNLPVQPTSFVGRERELSEARRLLEGTRLLTLTGPGGTGKTRLAVQAAAEELTGFADGAFYIGLDTITDPKLVASKIAEAVSVREESARPLAETVKSYLTDKELLLVLDNFEQVLEAGPFVSELLAAAPGVKGLVTSRTALGLYGEQEMAVPPLALPGPTSLLDAESLSQYEAVALFIERALASRADFSVTNENAPAVAEICIRLDGLPLAIELAAARIKILSPQAILQRLHQRLELLTRGARDLPARQRSLRGAIEWSYDLLEETERRMFERVSVFVGGCGLDAFEAVCSPGRFELDGLDALGSLMDKSLLRRAEGESGDPRFVMLETIREYGLEQLSASGEAEEVRDAHAAYFFDLAERAEPELTGREQRRWLDLVSADHDNFRAALNWATERADVEPALSAAGALWRFWQQRGHLAEGRTRTEELLRHPSAQPRTAGRFKALSGAGSLAYWQNDYDATRRHYPEALEIARELNDRPAIALGTSNMAFARLLEDDWEGAQELFRESAAVSEEVGDRLGQAQTETLIGWTLSRQGDLEGGLERYERGITLLRQVGDRFALADSLGAIALLYTRAGRHEAARSVSLEALELFEEAGNKSGVSYVFEALGELEGRLGRFDRAIRLAGAGDAIREVIGGGAPPELQQVEDPRRMARERMSDEEIDGAWAEGRAMSIEEALAYAREEGGT